MVALGLKTGVYNGVFQCFQCDGLFCTSGVSVSCSGNVASGKEIYHSVNHTQKTGREVFTPKLITKKDWKPLRSLPRLHFQTRSHIKENAKSV